MSIVETYSRLNGLEHILVHKATLWKDIKTVIAAVDAQACRTKVSKEKTKSGRTLYSPIAMNKCFKAELAKRGWHEQRTSYWVTSDHKLIRRTMLLPVNEQKKEILAEGKEPIFSYNQTDFVKERVALEVQFGKYSFVAYDLFVKHMAFYVGDVIDVGIEVLPMKKLQSCMSSGVPYYEGALYDLIRQGRGSPAVPLVMAGVAA